MAALVKVLTNFGAIKTKKKEIDMARTMKTIDGNTAAAHVAYALSGCAGRKGGLMDLSHVAFFFARHVIAVPKNVLMWARTWVIWVVGT